MPTVKILCIIICLILIGEQICGGKTVNRRRHKKQAPFDELISSALQLVRPIFGGARQLATSAAAKISAAEQENPMKPNPGGPPRLSSARLREFDILGMGPRGEGAAAMLGAEGGGDELPTICQGNSRICKFIACSAHNFKHDQNFANLQLAAQVLGDRKLRRTVGANAGAVGDVCREHGMSGPQCALFSRAFQLIDKFMTTIEDEEERHKTPETEGERERPASVGRTAAEPPKPIVPMNHGEKTTTVKMPTPATTFDPMEPQNDAGIGDDDRMIRRPFSAPIQMLQMQTTASALPSKGSLRSGSRTWSTHRHKNNALSNSLDNSAIEQNYLSADGENRQIVQPNHRPQQIFRPPPVPNSPPRAHHLVETHRTQISYSNRAPVQVFPAAEVNNGTAILISNGGSVPMARRVAPPSELARPPKLKQQSVARIHEGWSSRRATTTMTGPPLLVAQQASLIPYATYTPPMATPTTTTASSIPEAAEFAEEDGTTATKNELRRWRRRLRDVDDYYDEVAEGTKMDGDDGAAGNNATAVGNNGDDDEVVVAAAEQQLENCLQHLG